MVKSQLVQNYMTMYLCNLTLCPPFQCKVCALAVILVGMGNFFKVEILIFPFSL